MENSDKITTWIRLDGKFIDQEKIRSIKRNGNKTRISLISGADLTVNIEYDKVKQLLPQIK